MPFVFVEVDVLLPFAPAVPGAPAAPLAPAAPAAPVAPFAPSPLRPELSGPAGLPMMFPVQPTPKRPASRNVEARAGALERDEVEAREDARKRNDGLATARDGRVMTGALVTFASAIGSRYFQFFRGVRVCLCVLFATIASDLAMRIDAAKRRAEKCRARDVRWARPRECSGLFRAAFSDAGPAMRVISPCGASRTREMSRRRGRHVPPRGRRMKPSVRLAFLFCIAIGCGKSSADSSAAAEPLKTAAPAAPALAPQGAWLGGR